MRVDDILHPNKKQRTFTGDFSTKEVVVNFPCNPLSFTGYVNLKDGSRAIINNHDVLLYYADGELHIRNEHNLAANYCVTVIYE